MRKMTLLLLLCTTIMTAQKKEAVYKKIAAFACECANTKKDLTEMELGVCMFEAVDKLTAKEKKIINYNPDDKAASIETIAESIGFEMALICPKVFTLMAKIASDGEGQHQEPVVVKETYDVETGTLEGIVTNEFVKLVLSNDKKENKEFFWLFPFEGDSLLIKKKITKGDKLQISYVMMRFFNPKTNSYENINQIQEIKLL